jgi:hypothetical protein
MPQKISPTIPLPQHLASKGLSVRFEITPDRVVTINCIVITATGRFLQPITTLADRVTTSVVIPVNEIPISAFAVLTSSIARYGQIFCRINLNTDLTTVIPLALGYITTFTAVSYPSYPNPSPIHWPGNIITLTQVAPAAGAPLIFTCPTNSRIRPIIVIATLTTVGANTPTVLFTASDTLNNYYFRLSPLVHPAASARTYQFISNSILNETAFDAGNRITLSTPLLQYKAADTIELSGQDADDTWGAGLLHCEQLLEISP